MLDCNFARKQTFAGLPTFCPMTFHLLFSYSLIADMRAWLCGHIGELLRCEKMRRGRAHGVTYLVLSKLGVMHVLVPVLLDTTLRPGWECLYRPVSTNIDESADSAVGISYPTLAISAQLWPASLICFRRSSSAGVQGVLVRLFLTGPP